MLKKLLLLSFLALANVGFATQVLYSTKDAIEAPNLSDDAYSLEIVVYHAR